MCFGVLFFIAASYITRLEANKTSYLEMSMDTDQKNKKSPTKAYSLRQKVRDILERPEMVRPEPLNFRQAQQKKTLAPPPHMLAKAKRRA